mmetsp:Transcript_18735/g.52937  ORF Transcript_18735/g.52937 Transcript_18735/m.52937 type:complete len:633 (-) Transcript_18735:770-2668(-)
MTTRSGPWASRARLSRATTCFSEEVSQRSRTTVTPEPSSARSRSARPWPSRTTLPDRDARMRQRAPASASASADTTPRPPRPPVISIAPPSAAQGSFGGSHPTRIRFRALSLALGAQRLPFRYATSIVPSVASSSHQICVASSRPLPATPNASVSMQSSGKNGSSSRDTLTRPLSAAAAGSLSDSPASKIGPWLPDVRITTTTCRCSLSMMSERAWKSCRNSVARASKGPSAGAPGNTGTSSTSVSSRVPPVLPKDRPEVAWNLRDFPSNMYLVVQSRFFRIAFSTPAGKRQPFSSSSARRSFTRSTFTSGFGVSRQWTSHSTGGDHPIRLMFSTSAHEQPLASTWLLRSRLIPCHGEPALPWELGTCGCRASPPSPSPASQSKEYIDSSAPAAIRLPSDSERSKLSRVPWTSTSGCLAADQKPSSHRTSTLWSRLVATSVGHGHNKRTDCAMVRAFAWCNPIWYLCCSTTEQPPLTSDRYLSAGADLPQRSTARKSDRPPLLLLASASAQSSIRCPASSGFRTSATAASQPFGLSRWHAHFATTAARTRSPDGPPQEYIGPRPVTTLSGFGRCGMLATAASKSPPRPEGKVASQMSPATKEAFSSRPFRCTLKDAKRSARGFESMNVASSA